jgi:Kef-type K+ transport system membrane component KefB
MTLYAGTVYIPCRVRAPVLDLITSILILLVVAIGLGQIFDSMELPEVVGAIIAGIILGPAVTGIIHPSSELTTISLLALFFIILQIGIEASADIFSKNIRYITGFALTAFVVPFLVMSAGSYFIFGLPYLEAVSISLSVSIPSISITSVLLVRSGLIRTEDGLRLLGGVAMSDAVGFIILVSFHMPVLTIAIDSVSLAVFVVALYFLDLFLKSRSDRIMIRVARYNKLEKEGIIFAVVIVMGLAVSSLFEYIGITFVLGAFFSGLVIHQNSVGENTYGILTRTFRRINSSFFIPMFFSISGLAISVISISMLPYLAFLILITASIGGLAAYQFSKSFMKSIPPTASLGIFGGRGAVGIIIASISLSNGFISNAYYSIAVFATVIMAISFTLVFHHSLRRHVSSPQDAIGEKRPGS